MNDSRRDFIKKGLLSLPASVALSAGIPGFLNQSLAGMAALSARAGDDLLAPGRGHKILVLIQLDGGNDGLNTVVPWENGRYYRARKSIAIPEQRVLKLKDAKGDLGIGFHPEMPFFAEMFAVGKLALVNNVGYANPNRSHFRSGAIWQSAMELAAGMSESELKAQTGWLGRYFDRYCSGEGNLVGVYHGSAPLAMRGVAFRGTSISNMEAEPFGFIRLKEQLLKDPIFRKLQGLADGDKEARNVHFVRNVASDTLLASDKMQKVLAQLKQRGNGFPATNIGRQLGMIAQLITLGSSTRVYLARIGGFDTHRNQLNGHGSLWKQINDSVKAFMGEMQRNLLTEHVAVMTFSEFGRQLNENGTRGTDHGAAAPMFILGGGVKGGMFGKPPALKGDKVTSFGGLAHEIDFRSVYRSIIEQHLGVPSQGIVPAAYPPLKLF